MNGFFSPNRFDLEKFSELAVLANKHGFYLDFGVNDDGFVIKLNIVYSYYDENFVVCSGYTVYDCLGSLKESLRYYKHLFGNS